MAITCLERFNPIEVGDVRAMVCADGPDQGKWILLWRVDGKRYVWPDLDGGKQPLAILPTREEAIYGVEATMGHGCIATGLQLGGDMLEGW